MAYPRVCAPTFPGEPGQFRVPRTPLQAGQGVPGLTSSPLGKALEQAALLCSVASLGPLAQSVVIGVGPDPVSGRGRGEATPDRTYSVCRAGQLRLFTLTSRGQLGMALMGEREPRDTREPCGAPEPGRATAASEGAVLSGPHSQNQLSCPVFSKGWLSKAGSPPGKQMFSTVLTK